VPDRGARADGLREVACADAHPAIGQHLRVYARVRQHQRQRHDAQLRGTVLVVGLYGFAHPQVSPIDAPLQMDTKCGSLLTAPTRMRAPGFRQ
jgi:hypothetical protein